MAIRFYNTLTNTLEPFNPIDPPHVSMYNCGPTVYDFAHIGNFRAFVFADVLRRFLELSGHDVHQVMNITDVGHMTEDQLADGGGRDKMQVATQRLKEAKKQGRADVENPDDPYQVAAFFTDAFLDDARKLNLKVANEFPQHMPRATQHVEQMKAMIARLIQSGHAYVAQGDNGAGRAVYYDVQSFPDYGKLSGNTLDKLRGGAGGRVLDEHQRDKRHPADFLLWKTDASHIMKWDSPWGAGYPGWHIECSAMATHVLGRETIDIHTGGEDNIFPHHECEIAQTRGATGQSSFANVWLHTRFLLVNGEKMSKSKGNFFTVRDLLEGIVPNIARVHPAILRYELMRTHYRSNMDFTFKGLQDSAYAVDELRSHHARWSDASGGQAAEVDASHPVLKGFVDALSDDLNMSGALGVVFEWLKKPKGKAAVHLGVLEKIDSVLGVLRTPALGRDDVLARGSLSDEELKARLQKINVARAAKDFAAADEEKNALRALNYNVMDAPGGTVATARPVITI